MTTCLDYFNLEPRAPPRRITTYYVFISHRYVHSVEYRRLTVMLDRARQHDPTWRWVNVSIPVEDTVMTAEQVRMAEAYQRAIRRRMDLAHVVLYIAHDDWMDNAGSMYNELVECTLRDGYRVQIVNVVPPGEDPARWDYRGPGEGPVNVKWRAGSIIRAIRQLAVPVNAGELRLRADERAERRRILAALDAHGRDLRAAAVSLGVSLSTLRWNAARYLIR